ncbi:MAG: YIP1 family protein [Haloarculaceae archaeon]
MTQWVSEPAGGRERGPVALARAWFEVITNPRAFFRAAVVPGDQAPGLVFAAAVVLVAAGTRLLTRPGGYPVLGGRPIASGLLWLALIVLLVTPAALHLTAAVQTLVLVPFVDDRAGVSETVQVIAYATAPCVLAGLPVPGVVVVCCGYGTVLFVLGVATVHEVSLAQAALMAAIPAALVFGYGFGGVAAGTAVADALLSSLDRWIDGTVAAAVGA